MSEQGQRDVWGKIEIIGKGILVPIVVALMGVVIRNHLASIEEHSHTVSRDFTIMTEFQKIYTDRDSRRLAPYYVNRIEDPELRDQLRKFMVWDILEKNVPSSVQPVGARCGPGEEGKQDRERCGFRFEPEVDDWHMLGDVLLQMRRDPAKASSFTQWWQHDLQEHVLKERWPHERAELLSLFRWIAKVYWSESDATAAGRTGPAAVATAHVARAPTARKAALPATQVAVSNRAASGPARH